MNSDSEGRMNRRNVLRTLGTAGVIGVAACSGVEEIERSLTETETPEETKKEEPTETPEEWDIDPLEHDKLIGAHYYPWYHGPSQDWLEMSPREPILGEYDSRDEEVINQHIKWAREHGINWFNMSWRTDNMRHSTIRDHFLDADLSDEIYFSILYETPHQLPNFPDFDDSETRRELRENFKTIEHTFFDEMNYLEIDGRPVMYVYNVNSFESPSTDIDTDISGAFREAKEQLDTDPYLIASTPNIDSSRFWHQDRNDIFSEWVDEFDAISPYTLHDDRVAEKYDMEGFINYAEKVGMNGLLAAETEGLDYIPNLTAGVNTTEIEDSNPRMLERSPQDFREFSRSVMGRVDPDLDAVLVTSFNEWYEDSQVDPAESYGKTYLEIIGNEVAKREPGYNPEEYDEIQFIWNRTPKPEESHREIAVYVGELEIFDESGSKTAAYNIGVPDNEPYLVEGVYPPEEVPDDPKPLRHRRWFGGPASRTTIYLGSEVSDSHIAKIRGYPMDERIEADIHMNGEPTDHLYFGERKNQTYQISLTPVNT